MDSVRVCLRTLCVGVLIDSDFDHRLVLLKRVSPKQDAQRLQQFLLALSSIHCRMVWHLYNRSNSVVEILPPGVTTRMWASVTKKFKQLLEFDLDMRPAQRIMTLGPEQIAHLRQSLKNPTKSQPSSPGQSFHLEINKDNPNIRYVVYCDPDMALICHYEVQPPPTTTTVVYLKQATYVDDTIKLSCTEGTQPKMQAFGFLSDD